MLLEAFELTVETAPVSLVPGRIAGVEDEPSLPGRHKPVLGRLERRLRNHEEQYVAVGAGLGELCGVYGATELSDEYDCSWTLPCALPIVLPAFSDRRSAP